MTYLDWAATAIPREKILRQSLEESLSLYGNPSSPHELGFKSKIRIDQLRDKVAGLLHCSSSEIYFTSGATESNNIVNLSFLKKHGQGEIITSNIEHPSNSEPLEILKNFKWKVRNISPSSNGSLKIKKIIKSINEKTRLISLIYVHNETGVIQDLKSLIKEVRKKERELERPIHIHIDGVQAVGKIEINLNDLNIDSFSVSGHKFGAPKGCGLLYLKKERDVLYRGGGQEKGVRPGTESLFNIISLTSCLEESIIELETTNKRLTLLMSKLIKGARDINLSTIPKERGETDPNFVPNILSLTAPPVGGEVIVRVLNEKGFAISTGSACSSNKKSSTKGILSMGITEEEGFSSFRVSIGRLTTENDIVNFLKALKDSLKELAP